MGVHEDGAYLQVEIDRCDEETRRGEERCHAAAPLLVLDEQRVGAAGLDNAHAAVELQGAEWFEYVRGGLLSVGPSFLLYPAGS